MASTANTVGAIEIGHGPLSVASVCAIARGSAIVLPDDVLHSLEGRRQHLDDLAASGQPVYGVSTGFGALATTYITPAQRHHLQRSLIRSHAAGSGPMVEAEVVRAMMALRLQTLASGFTGVRASTALAYGALLNAHLTPVVHEYGSLGCSGDLAPLSHCALALMGEGSVLTRSGEVVPAAEGLFQCGLSPVVLVEKEGLALINGTDGMLSMLCLALNQLDCLLTTADLSAAMSIEALYGTDRVFAADLLGLRPHRGQLESGENLRAFLEGSPIVASHRSDETQVQDAYSLRCAPQVHGAVRDTVAHATSVATVELASVIDNPVVMRDGRIESNGNFHGAPVGYVLDFCAIALADLASMAERRTDRLLDRSRSHGLPPFLAHDPGVDSGHMIAQYTQAGLVAEMKRLAAPASVDSIPSSAMQEDHVSMGWHAGRKLLKSIDLLTRVLAIEVVTAARALDLREQQPAAGTGAARDLVRTVVDGPGPDRFLAPEIEAVRILVDSGQLVRAATAAAPRRR